MTVEAVYRGAMKAYPASWRHANEDEALGVLLDVAEAAAPRGGEARVDARQAASLVLNGLGARLELVLPARWRALAAASVMVGTTGFALIDLIFFEWQPWAQTPVYPHAGIYWALVPFSTPAVGAVLLWLAAASLWALGARAAARVLFAATAAFSVFVVHYAMHPFYNVLGLKPHHGVEPAPYFAPTWRHVITAFFSSENVSTGATLAVFIIGAIVVLCGDADRALRPSRQWLGALGAGVAILAIWRMQGGDTTVFFNVARRNDSDLWLGWRSDFSTGTPVLDASALLYFVTVGVAWGLRLRRLTAVLVSVLGPLAASWAVSYVLFHRVIGPMPMHRFVVVLLVSVAVGASLARLLHSRTGRPGRLRKAQSWSTPGTDA